MDNQALEQENVVEMLEVLDPRAAQVLAWRHEELARAGYSNELALRLAEDPRIDLHGACELLRRGCPEHAAYLILS